MQYNDGVALPLDRSYSQEIITFHSKYFFIAPGNHQIVAVFGMSQLTFEGRLHKTLAAHYPELEETAYAKS